MNTSIPFMPQRQKHVKLVTSVDNLSALQILVFKGIQLAFLGAGIALCVILDAFNRSTWQSTGTSWMVVFMIVYVVDTAWQMMGVLRYILCCQCLGAKRVGVLLYRPTLKTDGTYTHQLNSANYRAMWTVISVLVTVIWLRQYMITAESQGWSGPADKSSCQRSLDKAGTFVYNPNGYFPADTFDTYERTDEQAFCVLDQRWATNNGLHLKGYSGVLGQGEETSPGHVGRRRSDMPNLAMGVIVSNPLVLPLNDSATAIKYCPGSTATLPEGEGGPLPAIICPRCLGHWRKLSGDSVGPPGYELCTLTTERIDPICELMCPGRGFGWVDTNHSPDKDDLLVEFSLLTASVLWMMTGALVARVFLLAFGTTAPKLARGEEEEELVQ